MSELERSVTKTIDDGWEYMSTTTFSKPGNKMPSKADRVLKSFVYRRRRQTSAEFTGSQALALMKPVKKQAVKNEEEMSPPAAQSTADRKKTTLLTMAMLNAVRTHSQITPDTILPKLKNQGEITSEEHRVLSASLKERLSAAQIAGVTPPGHEEDVFVFL
ncbi:MAG: hypothetical protein AAF230_02065 [Pseudomonadota bacterium]